MWKLKGLVVTHILPGWWQGDPAHHLQGAGSSCKNKIWGLGDTSARISILQRKAIEIFLGHRVTLAGLHLVTLGGTVEVPLLCDTAWEHSLCGHRPRGSTGPLLLSSPLPQPQLAPPSHWYQYQERPEDNICKDIWAATLMKIQSSSLGHTTTPVPTAKPTTAKPTPFSPPCQEQLRQPGPYPAWAQQPVWTLISNLT